MASSRVKKFQLPEAQEELIPVEVRNLEGLLGDNGWKLLMDRIDKTIADSMIQLRSPAPLGMTREQKEVYYDDLEKIKQKITAYEELKLLPQQLIYEYSSGDVHIDNSREV